MPSKSVIRYREESTMSIKVGQLIAAQTLNNKVKMTHMFICPQNIHVIHNKGGEVTKSHVITTGHLTCSPIATNLHLSLFLFVAL